MAMFLFFGIFSLVSCNQVDIGPKSVEDNQAAADRKIEDVNAIPEWDFYCEAGKKYLSRQIKVNAALVPARSVLPFYKRRKVCSKR